MSEKLDLVYGTLPAELAAPLPGASQVSPLYPGSLALEDLSPASADSALMLAPPGTIERRYALAQILRALKPGAPFTVMAPKDKGGSRLSKELKELGVTGAEEDSKRHHRICQFARPEILEPSVDTAIAEGAPLFYEPTQLWTQPGVFSWNRIDAGSALLLEKLPSLAGRGADLGAGLGVLARDVLKNPAVKHLDLVELDRRAVRLAPKNLPADRYTIHWTNLREAELGLRDLDFVVTNPPFHDEGQEDRSLGLAFLEKASAMLKRGGTAWVVANRHLPYEAELKDAFKRVDMIADSGGYKVFEAVK